MASCRNYLLFCVSIALIFSWDHGKSQEKMETKFMQNCGGTNKEYYGFFESGLFRIVHKVKLLYLKVISVKATI